MKAEELMDKGELLFSIAEARRMPGLDELEIGIYKIDNQIRILDLGIYEYISEFVAETPISKFYADEAQIRLHVGSFYYLIGNLQVDILSLKNILLENSVLEVEFKDKF